VPPALASVATVKRKSFSPIRHTTAPQSNRETAPLDEKILYRSSALLCRHYRIIRAQADLVRPILLKILNDGNPYCVVKRFEGHNDERNSMQIARRLFNTEAGNYGKSEFEHDQIPPHLLTYFERK
jgi:hypothetical protein